MSVKPIRASSVTRPAFKMPEARVEAKVSKYATDDKFPDAETFVNPTRETAVIHLSIVPEENEMPEAEKTAPLPPVSKDVNFKRHKSGFALRKFAILKSKQAAKAVDKK